MVILSSESVIGQMMTQFTSISFFQKASGSFSFIKCMYAYAAHDRICIKIHHVNIPT